MGWRQAVQAVGGCRVHQNTPENTKTMAKTKRASKTGLLVARRGRIRPPRLRGPLSRWSPRYGRCSGCAQSWRLLVLGSPKMCRGMDPARPGGCCPWTILSRRNPDLLRREACRAPQACRGIPAAAAEPTASPLPMCRAGRFGQHLLPACRTGCQRWGGWPAGLGGCGRGRCRLWRLLAPWLWRLAGGAQGGLPAPGARCHPRRAGETGRRRMTDPGDIFIIGLEDSSLAFFFFSYFFPSLQIKKAPRRGGKGRGCELNPLCDRQPSWRWLRRHPQCSPRAASVRAWRSLLRLGLFQGIVQLLQRLFNPQGGEAG